LAANDSAFSEWRNAERLIQFCCSCWPKLFSSP